MGYFLDLHKVEAFYQRMVGEEPIVEMPNNIEAELCTTLPEYDYYEESRVTVHDLIKWLLNKAKEKGEVEKLINRTICFDIYLGKALICTKSNLLTYAQFYSLSDPDYKLMEELLQNGAITILTIPYEVPESIRNSVAACYLEGSLSHIRNLEISKSRVSSLERVLVDTSISGICI